MKDLRGHADQNKISIAQVMLANETSIAERTEQEVYAFIDKIINAMVATVKSGLSMPEDDVLPGPIKLHSKAATVYKRAMDDSYQADRGIGALSAYALAASEAAEGGCQAEIGVASSMAAALVATAYDAPSRVVENAADSALEHHLGMTCDPVVTCRFRASSGVRSAPFRLGPRMRSRATKSHQGTESILTQRSRPWPKPLRT